MKLFRKAAIALTILLFASAAVSYACTSIIVSGKVTPDGRPLIWKNRDTSAPRNIMRFFPAKDGKYAFTAVVAEHSKNPQSAWAGSNEKGFCIFNTVSYNVQVDTLEQGGGQNGVLMRKALEQCATIADFEAMLKNLPQPWGVATNYGVMDAEGNAAYFEVNFHQYFKYDVNDPAVAPDGYLVRANFSYNGRPVIEGKGHCRYMQADKMAAAGIKAGTMTPEYVIRNLARSYNNPLLDVDYIRDNKTSGWGYDTDFITRKTTTSSVVIKGVKKGEDPALTCMWTIISYPGTTCCIPVWEAAGEDGIPALIAGNEKRESQLSKWGYALKEKAYCWDKDNNPDNAKKYFDWTQFWNAEGTGVLQKVFKLEDEILPPYSAAIAKFYKKGKIDVKTIKALHDGTCAKVEKFYTENFEF